MNIYQVLKIFISILPIFILGVYIYAHDKEKEPTYMLVITFLAGVLVCIPCYIVESGLSEFFSPLDSNMFLSFIYILLSVSLVEEIFKFIAAYITAYNDKNLNYTFDCIVYSAFAALGFSFFENIIYLTKAEMNSMIIRAFTAVPVHLACGIIMGYYITRIKTQNKKRILNLIKSIIYPALIHSFYNYYLIYIANKLKLFFSIKTANIIEYVILILLLTILYLICHYIIIISSEKDKKIKKLKLN